MTPAATVEIWGGVEATCRRVGDAYSDQLARSGHRDRLDDLDRFADLGLRTLRYPVLWEHGGPREPRPPRLALGRRAPGPPAGSWASRPSWAWCTTAAARATRPSHEPRFAPGLARYARAGGRALPLGNATTRP
ncbi:MAG: hypothetical protein WKG07_04690 [Hymenobacter sp.]